MNIWQKYKKIILIVSIGILVAAIPLTLYLAQQEQDIRNRASSQTTLSFTPVTNATTPLSLQVNSAFALQMVINPGENTISTVRYQISYDPTKLALDTNPFTNSPSFPTTFEGPITSTLGKISGTVSVGSDYSKAVTVPTTVATVRFKAIASTGSTPTQVSYTLQSQALSTDPKSQATENVLQSMTPAYISVISPTPTPSSFTISGIFFEDVNDNTVIDPGEIHDRSLRPSIELKRTDGTLVDRVSNAGDGTGFYQFTNVPPGNYIISLLGTFGLNGYHISTPTPFPYPITVGPSKTVNIGIVQNVAPTSTPTPLPSPTPTRTPTPTPTKTPTPTPTRTPTPTPTLVPTNTPVPPTATPIPQATKFNFTLLMHGIGHSGDSVNPTAFSLSNQNPVRQQRNLIVEVLTTGDNPQKILTKSVPTALQYNVSTGNFIGTIDMGTTLSTGIYNVNIHSDQYLYNSFAGIQINAGQTKIFPEKSLITGDVNNDDTLNILDYDILIGCYSDFSPAVDCPVEIIPNTPFTLKVASDVTDDGNVNQFDYNLFLREYSTQGSNRIQ